LLTSTAETLGQNIAVLGFAFKADTGDTRESPAITLVRDFLSERAHVTIYDPQVEESQIWYDLSEALPDVPIEKSSSFFFFSLFDHSTSH
jgi:UDPglucose 6-dehydrogenase